MEVALREYTTIAAWKTHNENVCRLGKGGLCNAMIARLQKGFFKIDI